MKEIELTKGQVALVDDDMFEYLNQWKWCASSKAGGNFYAIRMTGGLLNKRTVIMHRLIIDAPPGMEVDHINMNGLDNRRENLRLCTKTQNQYNRGVRKGNSHAKGVRQREWGKWEARLRADGKDIYLGVYDTEEEAERVHAEGVKQYHGEFGRV